MEDGGGVHKLAHTFAFTLQLTPQGQWQCSYAIYECCVALFCCCEATQIHSPTHTHTHTHVLRERVTTHTHVRLLHKLMYNGLPECICMHLCTLNVHLRQQPHINSNTLTHTHMHPHGRSFVKQICIYAVAKAPMTFARHWVCLSMLF